MSGTQRVVGLVFIVMGAVVLCFAPVATVSCEGGNGKETSCRVQKRVVGLLPLRTDHVPHVTGVKVVDEYAPDPTRRIDRPPSKTSILFFRTPGGDVTFPGLDRSDGSGALVEIAGQVESAIQAADAGFTVRTFNWFPIVAGLIFFGSGLLAQVG